ncbi:MAG: asparagine synthase C-terminal domain-containing protein, partial [Sphingobium sp.]
TFSIGFDDPHAGESAVARETAARLGTRHHEAIVRPDALSAVDELVAVYDEPFADSSALPTLHLCRLAAGQVKVVLSGDGGDEAFGGYARYLSDLRERRWSRRIPRFLRTGVLRPLAAAWPKADWAPRPLRWKNALANLAMGSSDAYANTLALCRDPDRARLLRPLLAKLENYRPESRFAEAYAGDDDLAAMKGVDFYYHLPDDYLVKVDRASMAYGLEVRPPLVDHELLELTRQIPSELKIRNGETKWILKEAFAQHLPRNLRNRPKQGFEAPIDAWMRGPLRDRFVDQVLSPNSRVGEFIDRNEAEKMQRRHERGLGRHGATLWGLLVLAAWCDRYLGPSSAADSEADRIAATVP